MANRSKLQTSSHERYSRAVHHATVLPISCLCLAFVVTTFLGLQRDSSASPVLVYHL